MNEVYLKKIKTTSVLFKNNYLEISNGDLYRKWKLTEYGLLTTAITDLKTGQEWGDLDSNLNCDWELPTDGNPTGKLVSIDAIESDDEGFTSEHIRIECRFKYDQAQIDLIYVLWFYHNVSGMRTQFKVKSLSATAAENWSRQGQPVPKRIDALPATLNGFTRRYFGYYSDTQNRNDPFLDILKEEISEHKLRHPEWITWANAVCLEDKANGIAMVKESHKCVNHPGHNSGMFVADPENGMLNTGWGILANEIPTDRFTESWATWLFCWSDADHNRETAFKRFDRLRYPINADRDVYMQANTWGSTSDTESARRAAGEESVLQEIQCCAEIGIDVLQVDDGWQTPDPGSWNPEEGLGWRPHPSVYPDGWRNVVKASNEAGVKLGLWAAAAPISLEELIDNYEKGGFVQYKLDFAHLDSRVKLDELMSKARKFILSAGHQARVNWDLTEINPRYGYFFAREYGTIYLENRKPVGPCSAIYRPDTILRDIWQISKYINLSKFQATYQNIDMTITELSNAKYYTHSYCFAITMMATPLFFQETKYLSEAAKDELRPLIDAYKAVRKEIFAGTSYPIGEKPNGANWTGFQNIDGSGKKGYLTIFRELDNEQACEQILLHQLVRGAKLKLTNLLSEEATEVILNTKEQIELSIPQAPGFLFLKYDVI